VAQAEVIIDAGVQSFMHWLDQRNPEHGVVGVIQQLHEQAERWQEAELARARKRLSKGEPIDDVLQALSKGLTQKMLHGTLAELHTGDANDRHDKVRWISRLLLRSSRDAG
jgi:glutamyl-tRNA reductase